MSSTITTLGPHLIKIDYNAIASYTGLMPLIFSAIESNGSWELYDTLTADVDKVYRSPNLDGTTYKYVRIDTNGSYLRIEIYESWNTETNTGTAPPYHDDSNPGVILGFNSGYTIYVAISPRYIGIYSYNNFMGCFEVSRDADEDTSSSTFGYMTMPRLEVYSDMNFLTTRNEYNASGYYASRGNRLSTMMGRINGTGDANSIWSKVIPSTQNPHGGHYALTLHYLSGTTNSIRGRLYGIKTFTTNYGQSGDVVIVNVDADGFFDPAGTPTNHVLLSYLTCRFVLPY